MSAIEPLLPKNIILELILPQGLFPNNATYPFLIYKQPFAFTHQSSSDVQEFLKKNNWINSWVDGIYDYHHYHSNTHESLVIFEGECQLQVGGKDGKTYRLAQGDVVIFPAGVSHKNLSSTSDFKCIGAYPEDIEYDMNYGKKEEHPQVDENIRKVGLPSSDPVFGKKGILFDYWK